VNLTTQQLRELKTAIDNELDARQTQLNILTDTLESLLAVGASDALIEQVLLAIDIIDAAAPLSEPETGSGGGITTACENPEPDEPEDDEPYIEPRRRVIAELRSLGYSAPGLDALVRLYHRDIAEQEYLRAESDCRGHMLKREHAGYSARKLWFCNERELRKYASDEMLTWFDENGRTTYLSLRDHLLTGRHYAGSGYLMNR
jgi:hypothetical protein